MKTNKILCMLLAAAMIFALCACGSTPAPTGTQTVTAGPAASGTVTAAEPETAEEPEEDFSVGATANNTYENEYFGIGVTLDDSWIFSTQEEINEMNGMTSEILDDEVYAAALENGTVFTDMQATADEGMLVLNATIEKLPAVATLAIDEDSYIDITLENNDFKGIFEEMGFEDVSVEKGSATIAGVEHPCIVIAAKVQGIDFYEKTTAIKNGKYVLTVTASSIMEDVVDDIFASFYAL